MSDRAVDTGAHWLRLWLYNSHPMAANGQCAHTRPEALIWLYELYIRSDIWIWFIFVILLGTVKIEEVECQGPRPNSKSDHCTVKLDSKTFPPFSQGDFRFKVYHVILCHNQFNIQSLHIVLRISCLSCFLVILLNLFSFTVWMRVNLHIF